MKTTILKNITSKQPSMSTLELISCGISQKLSVMYIGRAFKKLGFKVVRSVNSLRIHHDGAHQRTDKGLPDKLGFGGA